MTSTLPLIIAIDGPAASGKGTVAKRLAKHLGFPHLDTGLLYRAVGMGVLRQGGDPSNPAQAEPVARNLRPEVMENDTELRSDAAAIAASKAAAIQGVRAALLKFQQDFCAKPPGGKEGAVLDGRDTGTIIAPNADVKIFITASVEMRASRRVKELQSRGEDGSHTAVLADMKERDARDAKRTIAPLVPAPDAYVLDTTDMTADQAFEAALTFVRQKTGRG
jgi:cytidylate kinase